MRLYEGATIRFDEFENKNSFLKIFVKFLKTVLHGLCIAIPLCSSVLVLRPLFNLLLGRKTDFLP